VETVLAQDALDCVASLPKHGIEVAFHVAAHR
jgi:hypothetical protein